MDLAALCSERNGWVKVVTDTIVDQEEKQCRRRRSGPAALPGVRSTGGYAISLRRHTAWFAGLRSGTAARFASTCWNALRFIEEPCCPRLGIPFPYDPGPGQVSAAALADPPPWMRARSAVAYDDAAKPIVHALKYRDRHEAASLMTTAHGAGRGTTPRRMRSCRSSAAASHAAVATAVQPGGADRPGLCALADARPFSLSS